jgi:Family of unknown function (DUF6338)
MKTIAPELVEIIRYLLPGFLMAWVFHGLTPFPRGSEFERIVEALVFNLPVQLCVAIESAVSLRLGKYFHLGVWSKTSDLTAATLSAFALGFIFAYLANGDRCHRIARHLKITRETSYPSEWFGTFAENQRTLVVLHLKDERRLYGWPDEWPSSPSVGHFRLSSPSWLVDGKDIPIQGARYILLNVKDVKWVEFIDKPPEVINVQERAESTPDADRSGA